MLLTAIITDANGFGVTPVTYEWIADGDAIADATKSNYMLTADEFGKAITVSVTNIGNDNFAEYSLSYLTAAVTEKLLDIITSRVVSIKDNSFKEL